MFITPEDKSSKQQNHTGHSFHWQPYQSFPQLWSSAVNRFEVIKTTSQSSCDRLCVKALYYPIRRATRLNYSSQSTQWRSQPKNFFGVKIFDFRRTTVFYLGYRFSKNKMIENVAGHGSCQGYAYATTTVALYTENCHLCTTWQESELMFHSNGLSHHNVIML